MTLQESQADSNIYSHAYNAYHQLPEAQKQFIDVVYIRCRKYEDAAKESGVDISTIRKWNVALEPIWRPITKLRNTWKVKNMNCDFLSFFKWIATTERTCYYCGITEAEIVMLNNAGAICNKRALTRGSTLELDRKESVGKYDEQNMVLCCYWCNNAKTDTFTEAEFKQIGAVIGSIWKKRLAAINNPTAGTL